jgi:NADH-quinone oxidoreductase subunit D
VIANPVRPAFDKASREDTVIVSIGPSHPATHGTIQIFAELDGERILRADVHCGYLHRGFEKECEDHTWHNLIPYVDRLNYVSALINDFAYCDAVEHDGRADHAALRALPRLSRLGLVDHLTCRRRLDGMGAMTRSSTGDGARLHVRHLAALTGARVTYTYGRRRPRA